MKGVRIHTIVRELNNENIDVINYSDQPDVFVQRALAPAKILELTLNAEAKTGDVLVAPDQVSLAIGRNGQNIRLAAKLTGYDLNLIKEGGDDDEYDIELVDFKEDLGEELYHKLINAGFDTAKEVLNAKMETLLAIEGLDEALINQTREMMQRDLEEAEVGEGEIDVSRKALAENEDQATAAQEDQAPAEQENQAPAGQEEQVMAGEEAEKKQDQAADEPPKTGE
jgi:N utilization substance protein A